jgi:hypothetical protein
MQGGRRRAEQVHCRHQGVGRQVEGLPGHAGDLVRHGGQRGGAGRQGGRAGRGGVRRGLDATLQELESLKATIKAKQDTGDSCDAYILIQELSERLAEIELPGWRDFEHELCVAWTAYSEAKKTARDAKGQADEAKAKYDDAKAFYDNISELDHVWAAILQCCCKPKPTGDCKQAQS